MIRIALVFIAFVVYSNTQSTGSHTLCPEPNGKFPVLDQCDAYIECTDGVAEQKLCPEGMVLTNSSAIEWECTLLPPHLACGDRKKLQPPQPTEECPHQFGLFRIGDAAHCGQYLNCANGVASVTNCSRGLAFNSETWRCDWPDEVADCNPEAYLEFTCPQVARQAPLNPEDGDNIHYYPWEHDCRYYFACVNSRPRLQTCGYCKCYHDLIDADIGGAQADLPINAEAPEVKGFSVDEVLNIQIPKGRV